MRYVIKIGSSSLTLPNGNLNTASMARFVSGIAQLALAGHQVALVSSGAVAAGYQPAGFSARPQQLQEKQAAAAIGQCLLVHEYHQLLAPYGLNAAQILLTADDLESAGRRQNAISTLEYLLAHGAVPIINENDTVAVEELTFGDNDQLAALVATATQADALAIITDTPGLYDKNPRLFPEAVRLQRVDTWDDNLLSLAQGKGELGTGGMLTKLQAAKRVMAANIPCFVGRADSPLDLLAIFAGEGNGTYFGNALRHQAFAALTPALHSNKRGAN